MPGTSDLRHKIWVRLQRYWRKQAWSRVRCWGCRNMTPVFSFGPVLSFGQTIRVFLVVLLECTSISEKNNFPDLHAMAGTRALSKQSHVGPSKKRRVLRQSPDTHRVLAWVSVNCSQPVRSGRCGWGLYILSSVSSRRRFDVSYLSSRISHINQLLR